MSAPGPRGRGRARRRGRPGLRALMALVGVLLLVAYVGVLLLVAYVGAAALAYWALAWLWAARPDPATTLLVVAATAVGLGLLSYAFGTRRLLASLNAVEVECGRAPALYDRLDELAAEMDVATPTVYVGAMRAPNAFALGGFGSGSVVLDRSLFRLLSTAEVDAILAHELAHLESNDGLVQTLAFSLGRTVAAVLAVRAHSRGREFAADDRACEVTGRPLALARALEKIERASDPEWGVLAPLYVHGDDENPIAEWFSTHPSVEERVERLRERAAGGAVSIPVE